MTARDALVEALDAEQAAFTALLATIPHETQERKGVIGAWSIKNVVAHMASWELVVLQALPELLDTGKQPPVLATIAANEDAWNAVEIAEGEALTAEDQLAEWAWAGTVLVHYLRELDEAALTHPNLFEGYAGSAADYVRQQVIDHRREHREVIAALGL